VDSSGTAGRAAQNDNKELGNYGLPRPARGLAMTRRIICLMDSSVATLPQNDGREGRMTPGSESGRSMVEILGVLAIIGVLTVGGVAGYDFAMTRYRANEIIESVKQREGLTGA